MNDSITNNKTNRIVKYKNEINRLNLSKLTPTEQNVFMTIISTIKNAQDREIELPFLELRKNADIDKHILDTDFEALIKSSLKKVGAGSFTLETNNVLTIFPLFESLIVDSSNRVIKYRVSNMFIKYFNYFKEKFTYFKLDEFVSIKTKYGKTIFRLLKQFSKVGVYEENYDKFIYVTLGVPVTTPKRNINMKYIKPNVELLAKTFKQFRHLKMELIKDGLKIKKIRFTWDPNDWIDVELPPYPDEYDNFAVPKQNSISEESKAKIDESWDELMGEFGEHGDKEEDENELPF